MGLRIFNGYHTRICAMIEWYHPNCPEGGDWEKQGWWVLVPGQEKTVFKGDMRFNRWWYVYCFAEDGDRVWDGPFPELVPNQPFKWCEARHAHSREVGMFELEATWPRTVITFR